MKRFLSELVLFAFILMFTVPAVIYVGEQTHPGLVAFYSSLASLGLRVTGELLMWLLVVVLAGD